MKLKVSPKTNTKCRYSLIRNYIKLKIKKNQTILMNKKKHKTNKRSLQSNEIKLFISTYPFATKTKTKHIATYLLSYKQES